MGTEVLLPQDLLNERLRGPHASSSFQRRRNFPANGNLSRLVVNNNRKGWGGNSRKPSPRGEKKRFIAADHGAVGREVTLMRRGESLDSLISSGKRKGQPDDDLSVFNIGPASPEMKLPVYAGSACCLSPSPKALPLPSFFSNKKQQNDNVSAANPDTDSATRDLRRLLRLN